MSFLKVLLGLFHPHKTTVMMWKVTMSIGKDYESHKIHSGARLLRFNTQPDVFLAVWLLVGYLIAVHPKLTTKASPSRWESEIAMSKFRI